MTKSLNDSHQRALDDLLQAERDLRRKSEDTIRAMRQVLVETANRLGGTRLESLRRDDPSIPANWGALDWKNFFDEVSAPSQGWSTNTTVAPGMHVQREQQKQIMELQAALHQAKLDLATEQAKSPTVSISSTAVNDATHQANTDQTIFDRPTDIPTNATPSLTFIVEDTKRMHKKIQKKTPAAFTNLLSGGERSGGDLTRVFERYWLILYLIGHWRLTAAMELEEVLAETVGVSAGSGSVERVLLDMEKAKIILIGKLELKSPRTVLKLYRFSSEGEKLYQSLFAARPYENDWSRLIRLREGERFPEHTLAVLAFTMHARKRGWATQVLPDAASAPNTLVMRGDEKYFVEVDLGENESVTRWRNQSSLNDGRIALCVATQRSRTHFVAECQQGKLPGMATDLESLIMGKFKNINSDTPLWMESWK